jgi:hypothetical protein
MKTIFAIVLWCTFAVAAQGQMTTAGFSRRCTELDSLRRISWNEKDFLKAAGLLAEMHADFLRLADSDRAGNRWVDVNVLYNTACAYALMDSAGRAMQFLTSSVDEGFTDYYTMVADNDLVSLRYRKDYQDLLLAVQEKGDFSLRLKRASKYLRTEHSEEPEFTYQQQGDSNLVRLRVMYHLDSVAGGGDEISRIIRLMRWAHHSVRHDGSSSNPPSRNAIDIIDVCTKEHRGVNCRMMATILNEAYLAMGFPSRHITCLPMDTTDTDCHVITIVYSSTLKKWIWMDPTFEAYVMDPHGNYLNPGEVRRRLIAGDSVVVDDGINWNGKPYDGGPEGYMKRYMTKNLYWFQCPVGSEFGYESKKGGKMYVTLLPSGYNPRGKTIGVKNPDGDYYTCDDAFFWQPPPSR